MALRRPLVLIDGRIHVLPNGDTLGAASFSGGGGLADTFETISKNLSASDAVLNYVGSDLSSIVYANGITKTLTYGVNGLASVTLSGETPGGIDLTKTFIYSGGNLTGFSYS